MQHDNPGSAQTYGAPSFAGLGLLNSGLVVINPSKGVYDLILAQLDTEATLTYDFPDQALLADVFSGRWVALPYTYNALKTMRTTGVHDRIWRDEEVKNIHYILSPKPWDDENGSFRGNPTHEWWWKVNEERLKWEAENGIAEVV
jgi:lipopolysaccharide biosynthesis glycosyltransferase